MHKLLERQIKHSLGDIEVANLTSGWKKFLDAVSETYAHSDEDRTLLTRSLDLSSEEHSELNKHLQNEVDAARAHAQEIENLKVAQGLALLELKKEIEELKK